MYTEMNRRNDLHSVIENVSWRNESVLSDVLCANVVKARDERSSICFSSLLSFKKRKCSPVSFDDTELQYKVKLSDHLVCYDCLCTDW